MEKITISVDEARAALGLGNTRIYELIGSGQLRSTKLGRRRLIFVDSVRELVGAA